MLVKTAENYLIHHVMWQPLSDCVGGCKDCYVKKSPAAQYKGSLKTDILNLVYEAKKIQCNQFTISLDTFRSPSKKIRDLVNVLKKLLERYWNQKDQLPELCITARDFNTIQQWCQLLNVTHNQFMKAASLISLSDLPVLGKDCEDLRELCKANETTLCFNKVVKERTLGLKSFIMGCRYADTVHLVLLKEQLGLNQNLDSFRNYKRALAVAEAETTGELVADRCLSASINYLELGSTCSANIDMIHVWPGGSVTGCPYDSSHLASGGCNSNTEYNTLMELERILGEEACHPMKFCSISTMFREIIKSTEVNQFSVANRA